MASAITEDPIRFKPAGPCGWGKRARFGSCGVCRRLVIFGRSACLDLRYPSSAAGGAHWCGHRKCIRHLRAAALIAADRPDEM